MGAAAFLADGLADEGVMPYECVSMSRRTLVLLSFCQFLHTSFSGEKRPETGCFCLRSVGRWQTRHVMLANVARCVWILGVGYLSSSCAEKCAKTGRKGWFCKA